MSVIGIMFCARLVPKDIPRDHPCHLNDTNDHCSQKAQKYKYKSTICNLIHAPRSGRALSFALCRDTMGILSFSLKGGRGMPAELHTTLTPDTPVRYLKGVRPQDCRAVREAGHPDPQRPALPLSPPVSGFFKALLHRRGPRRHRVRREGRSVCKARRAHPAGRAADGAHHRRGRCIQSRDHVVQ